MSYLANNLIRTPPDKTVNVSLLFNDASEHTTRGHRQQQPSQPALVRRRSVSSRRSLNYVRQQLSEGEASPSARLCRDGEQTEGAAVCNTCFLACMYASERMSSVRGASKHTPPPAVNNTDTTW